jgi:Fe-S-cluster-containing hydrogenase component 2
VKALLSFDTHRVTEPIISAVVLEKKVPINILRAQINERGGHVLVEIPDWQSETVLKALRDSGVGVQVKKLIEILRDKCVDCGHCITLCPVHAINYESDLTVEVEEQKCIQCGRCADACPVTAISILG